MLPVVSERKLFTTLLAMMLLAGCKRTTPEAAQEAREGMSARNAQPDSIGSMIDATVPSAVAGDPGWTYSQRVTADFDGSGDDEEAVLISDVALDARGRPLWEDGHRWQLYIQETDGKKEVTRLFARFIPNGKVTAEVGIPSAGAKSWIVLLVQSPERIAVYEFEYRAPGSADVRKRLERDLDVTKQFSGSPRP
jgi:hypothetical protein